MKDRLTKKRVHVDYEEIIELLDLSHEFHCYRCVQVRKGNFFSRRRCAFNFLRSRDVAFYWCQKALNDGCKSFSDLVKYCGSEAAAKEFAYGV